MSDNPFKRAPDSLIERARKLLAGRGDAGDLNIVSLSEQEDASTGRRLYRFLATRRDDPNGPQSTVVLDESGEVVDEESIGARTRRTLFGLAEAALDAATLRPVASPAASITINPTTNDLTLNAGDAFDETITVTIPADSGVDKVDIYFLADTTGSMGSILTSVQADANTIVNTLAALPGLDMAFGVGNYKDFPHDAFAFEPQLSLTAVSSGGEAAAVAAINLWAAGGGSDGPEGQFFALDQLAQPAGGSIGWRSGAKRIIVWIGDAPGHDPVCTAISGLSNDITEASVTAKLNGSTPGIPAATVLAISTITGYANGLDDDPVATSSDYNSACGSPLGSPGQATRIAAATGGVHETGINTTNIVQTIIDLVSSAATTINNVSLVPTGGTAPFVVSISPAGGYGPLSGDDDHVLPFEVKFKGVVPCKDTEQVFTGTLDVIADGVVVARKRVRITVPACRPKEFYVYSVKFVCGTQRDHKERCAPVRPGSYSTEINIHNFNEAEARIQKYVIPVVLAGAAIGREPRVAERKAKDSIVLPPHTATMDDCCRIGELLFEMPPPPHAPLTIGFLEIISTRELNVTAVYTATDLKSHSISIDVEQVQGRRIRRD